MVGGGAAAGLDALLARVRSCTICADHLALGPRPVLRMAASARVLIIGQAPGTRVHETGIPWNDPSGERLRAWMDMEPGVFYDEARVAIMPMGFCYPGRDASGGDKPPRPECAPAWHDALLTHLPGIRLTLLVGAYAQARYLKDRKQKTLTETVRAWRGHGPDFLPLPHPSWRNTGWLKRNPWFEADVIPDLRARLARALG